MHLRSPYDLKKEIPLSREDKRFIADSRGTLVDILEGRDPRILLIIGPCSIHSTKEGLLFAQKLRTLADSPLAGSAFVVMRAYIEKPRTHSGWKGLVYDPHLDGSGDLRTGLAMGRQFLVDLARLRLPAATEFLTPHLVPYIEDTITWGCVGARTSSSQVHRLFASHLSMPIGFKNTVDGNIDCAIHAVAVAGAAHTFIDLNEEGRLCQVTSRGNPHTHVVLRGSLTGPNYDERSVAETLRKLREQKLPERALIDCSHGNSGGRYYAQKEAFESACAQIQQGNRRIVGMMLESNLEAGKQSLPPYREGISVTDGCLDFSATQQLVSSLLSSHPHSADPRLHLRFV